MKHMQRMRQLTEHFGYPPNHVKGSSEYYSWFTRACLTENEYEALERESMAEQRLNQASAQERVAKILAELGEPPCWGPGKAQMKVYDLWEDRLTKEFQLNGREFRALRFASQPLSEERTRTILHESKEVIP